MKFAVAFLALLAPAAAFAPQGPAFKTTALNSANGNYANLNGDSFAQPGQVSTATINGQDRVINRGGEAPTAPAFTRADEQLQMRKVDASSLTAVQGGSLRTWAFSDATIERVQVFLKTDGRPLNANVELWQGPDNTPQKMGVYVEDGSLRPFNAVIETPRGHNAVAVRNTAAMEFPIQAFVDDTASPGFLSLQGGAGKTVQGGAVRTYAFDPSVDTVAISLTTDGRPLNARIELLQGPNNNKQVVELYSEDGLDRPFFSVIETPGSGNVVRVVNTATMEYPMIARVEPYNM